jgi:hypothetical protein
LFLLKSPFVELGGREALVGSRSLLSFASPKLDLEGVGLRSPLPPLKNLGRDNPDSERGRAKGVDFCGKGLGGDVGRLGPASGSSGGVSLALRFCRKKGLFIPVGGAAGVGRGTAVVRGAAVGRRRYLARLYRRAIPLDIVRFMQGNTHATAFKAILVL